MSLELLYMFNANSLPLLKIYFELDDNCKIEHIEHINNECQLVLLGIYNLYIYFKKLTKQLYICKIIS